MSIQETSRKLDEIIALHAEHGTYIDKVNDLRKLMQKKGKSTGIVDQTFLYSNEEGTFRFKFDDDGDLESLHLMKSLEDVLDQKTLDQPE